MIINYASSGFNKLKASLNDDARVIIYDCHMFIVQATDFAVEILAERLNRVTILNRTANTYKLNAQNKALLKTSETNLSN